MKRLELKSIDTLVASILATRTFGTMADVMRFIEYRYQHSVNINDIVAEILKFNFNFSVTGIDWNRLVLGVIRQKNNRTLMTGDWSRVVLYDAEISLLRTVLSPYARQMLFLLLVIYKWNAHPTGWIELPREDCFEFWGLQNLCAYQKEEIMRECVSHGLQLRVIGSKEPIICFHINWVAEEGDIARRLTDEEDIKRCYEELINE